MKKFVFLSIACSLIMACASKPSDYQAEITDAVKFYTATWQTAIETSNADEDVNNVWAVRDKLTDEYSLMEEQKEAFRILLEKENSEEGKKILANYNLMQPALSEYSKTENKREWIFQEQNTGVHFYFRLKEVDKKEHFEIEPDEKETQHYLGRKLLGEKMLQLYEALGIDVDSLIDASLEESKMEENQMAAMREVVDLLYSGKITDDKVVSFEQDIHKVISDGSDDWAVMGYWKYSDGHFHKYNIEECVLESDFGPYVLMTLTDTPQPVQIAIVMRQEGDKWFVTDILGIEDGVVSYAFSDYITVAIAEDEAAIDEEH
ncbi:MAG: hypothetical protein J6T80_00665 [Paludibacteraceae bacterium]|nr:hypothetical protein [Paludibacteraceae bacterium]